ncbi:MAG: TIGR01212 family radical SAM protein [Clostridiales bacterium]|nr:TIGR01212 family radical SAM protein [Clostridiales bacterium]
MNEKPYNSLDLYLKKTFGRKLYKLALESGIGTCPNRDGTKGVGGCIFCGESGSGDFAAEKTDSVTLQLERAKELVKNKIKDDGKTPCYIAYFQSFTNTYAPTGYLEKIFTEAINDSSVAVLSVATRPDCLPVETLDLLGRLNKIKPVWVELGLQTSNERTAGYINRCFDNACFENAVRELKNRGVTVIVHMIIGLPGETKDDMINTVKYINSVRADGIKLQLLHVLKGTRLERESYVPLTLSEYTDILIGCIENLSPDVTVHRITGDGNKRLLVSPLWSADKKTVLNTIHREMKERNSYQGKEFTVDCPETR